MNRLFLVPAILLGISAPALGINMAEERLASMLVALDGRVLTPEEFTAASGMLQQDAWVRVLAANNRENLAWAKVGSKDGWEQFRDDRLEALRASLGSAPTTAMEIVPTRTIQGEGFRIENLVVAGRRGLPITANLYLPDPPGEAMPGILLCNSHHNPKTQGELQDMGMTWSRSGAMVLVMENLGHGERRQQPFGGREDYHWRYNLGIQLHLVGESLIGWMVADLRRGLDVLLARPRIDAARIILMGAVAGGGDPAAITAALDGRVTCSIPFNFGCGTIGQPTTPGAEAVYNFAGFADWESTRCLRLSGRDGFFPWVIVAAGAPRRLIFAKEFAFDPANDPAYQRVRKVYELYGAADRLAEMHGYGNVRLRPPAASHCNNVGPHHRQQIYPILQKWLGMPAPEEYQQRLEPDELSCMTPQANASFRPRKVHEIAAELAAQKITKARDALAPLAPAERRERLRGQWARLLGDVEPRDTPTVKRSTNSRDDELDVEKILLAVEPRILVPVVLLTTPNVEPLEASRRRPVVICFAQQGKGDFLVKRAHELAALLARGVAVCLPDLRGTGETSPGADRSYATEVTNISARELKLGQTLVGSRLRDLRSVMRYLRSRRDINASRIGLWGDSFAPVNPQAFTDPPLRTSRSPHHAEPLGALLAILGAVYEQDVKAVVARGGLTGYAAVLEAAAFYVPHDAIVPGLLETGDLCDLAGALAPLALRLEAMVDGRNRSVGPKAVAEVFAPTRQAYAASADRLVLMAETRNDAGQWLAKALAD